MKQLYLVDPVVAGAYSTASFMLRLSQTSTSWSWLVPLDSQDTSCLHQSIIYVFHITS